MMRFGGEIMEKKNFIDIHSHALFGVDDGAKDIDDSLRMLEMERDEGVRKMILTWHFYPERADRQKEKAEANFRELSRRCAEVLPEMELYTGNEIMYDRTSVRGLDSFMINTLAGSMYALVEFHPDAKFDVIAGAVREFNESGYLPIIAHVERYMNVHTLGQVDSLIGNGAYIQVNSRSLTRSGRRGSRAWTESLLTEGMIHFVADDTHNDSDRKPFMGRVYDMLSGTVDESILESVFVRNPEAVLNDEYI